MRKPNKFWDKMAPGYAKSPVSDPEAYEHKLKITQSHFTPDMELMEFGCGTGSTAIRHAPFVKHILATDFSEKMLEIAKEKVKKSGINNISFQQSSIDEFQAADGSYDVIMGMSILHLLKDKKAAIKKVHKLLKPGGLFISNTVCLGDNMKFMKYLAPIGKFLGLTLKVFSTDELVNDLQEAGFVIEYNWQSGKKGAVFIVARKEK